MQLALMCLATGTRVKLCEQFPGERELRLAAFLVNYLID